MLLQTNSYIVPKERRAEHARLIRRFRQALARIGCDQFEVYEQVGANWSPGGANGRYVQIMKFRDRQHQQAVQAAERNDHGAQQIISEFCDLINFPYQQQHGYFATGFYTSVLPTGPRQAVDYTEPDVDEEPVAESEAAAGDVFTAGGTVPDLDAQAEQDELQGIEAEAEQASAEVGLEPEVTEPSTKAHSSKGVEEPLEVEVEGHESDSRLGSSLDMESAAELQPHVADAGQYGRFQGPDLGSPDAGSAEVQIPLIAAVQVSPERAEEIEDVAILDADVASEAPHAEPTGVSAAGADAAQHDELFEAPATDVSPFESAAEGYIEEVHRGEASAEPVSIDEAPTGEVAHDSLSALPVTAPAAEDVASEQPTVEEPVEHASASDRPGEDEFEIIDHGLLFEDDIPAESMPHADLDASEEHAFALDEPVPHASVEMGTSADPDPVAPHVAAPHAAAQTSHSEPHEELLPPIRESFGSAHESSKMGPSDDSDLDALLDDANLLDNVPFPGALEDAPRLHPRHDPPGGNGHATSAEKDSELLEFEALMRQLEEDPSADHGRLA